MPPTSTVGYDNGLMAVVCPMPDRKSRMERCRKLKIGTKEAHDTGNPWPRLEVKKVKDQDNKATT